MRPLIPTLFSLLYLSGASAYPTDPPATTATDGCPGHGKPGVILHNGAHGSQTFVFYKNRPFADPPECNNSAQADDPYRKVTIKGGAKKFVHLPLEWKGHVQRDGGLPATWAEFQLRSDAVCQLDGYAHGDISVIQGNDGPAVIKSTDGTGVPPAGFTENIIPGAPKKATTKKANGQLAIKNTETSVDTVTPGNPAALHYSEKKLDTSKVYVHSDDSTEVVQSTNHCLEISFGAVH